MKNLLDIVGWMMKRSGTMSDEIKQVTAEFENFFNEHCKREKE